MAKAEAMQRDLADRDERIGALAGQVDALEQAAESSAKEIAELLEKESQATEAIRNTQSALDKERALRQETLMALVNLYHAAHTVELGCATKVVKIV